MVDTRGCSEFRKSKKSPASRGALPKKPPALLHKTVPPAPKNKNGLPDDLQSAIFLVFFPVSFGTNIPPCKHSPVNSYEYLWDLEVSLNILRTSEGFLWILQ